MGKKIKWGVIGCGGIAARRTIPEFLEMADQAELISVMCRTQESAKSIASQFNVQHWCNTEQELLDQDIDAVYIASPQHVHCKQVIMAAEAGKHILCEKPLALNADEATQMKNAIKKANIKFMMAFCMRNNIYNNKARELVQAGTIGQLVMGRAELTCWYPPIPGAWRQDKAISNGGSLIDMGSHCLDMLEWIMDSKIVEVTGFQDKMTHDYPTDVEDASTILVRFDNGAHGIIDNYFNLPDASAQNSLELHGTKGSIIGKGTIGQDPTGTMFSIIQDKESAYNANQERNIDVKRQEYQLEGQGLYGQMINQLSRCILDDTEPPITIDDGCHSVKLVNAIYTAVKERRIIKV